ncbi:MAG: hypothetical protein Q8K93_32375 [Reyranella sp.]|uniref:hypothetical protein n=1 Tax=Reyranella sp. TaxID=1929291 RepID=UPI00272F9818|nr:hypothetical protein [Reyranella sp.]MDP1966890.1 hypothetical protein [Reyranella sp.]MDP2375047.1 hypothetical protein [Reyranella sp.]
MRLRCLPLLGLFLLPALAPILAHAADPAAATACAGQLSADGQMFYGKVAGRMTPTTDIREELEGVGRPLVMAGTMSRTTARAAAEAAGECLKQLK